jgi:hypothetical protein
MHSKSTPDRTRAINEPKGIFSAFVQACYTHKHVHHDGIALPAAPLVLAIHI